MKLLVIFSCLVLAISAATDEDLWSQFKIKHDKSYRSLREEKLRYSIFQNNLRTIEVHNTRYEQEYETFYMGVTKFADLTPEEFRKSLVYKKQNVETVLPSFAVQHGAIPDALDWREKGAVVGVKNQGVCGSSWAFSATGSLEGQIAIKYGELVSVSEQELIDCSQVAGNTGCTGGLVEYAFDYVKQLNGISTASNYPYMGVEESCKIVTPKINVTLTGYAHIDKNEDALKEAVASVGPISVTINADLLQLYVGGIFNDSRCTHMVNHGVLAVGYGIENSLDYWIIKNSWGINWGEEGYIRMARNANNLCAIASGALYPIIV